MSGSLHQLLGQTLGERYELRALLGQGGMGAVFGAHDRRAGRPVAVKVLLPEGGGSHRLHRFRREARLASAIRHPHVVRVLDFGQIGGPGGGPGGDPGGDPGGGAAQGEQDPSCFLVMELIEGGSLHDLLDAELSAGAICDLTAQLLGGLARVHAHGVLHRDIKPENVLVGRAPGPEGRLVAKLTDFGISVAQAEESTRLTAEGAILGTPHFMAPEQVLSAPVLTPASDLYAVGVMLYRFFSGRYPFEGKLQHMLLARLSREPDPLEPRAGLALEPELRALVTSLLRQRPEQRPQRAAEVIAALEPHRRPALLDERAWAALLRGDGEPERPSASAETAWFPQTRASLAETSTPEDGGLAGRAAERAALLERAREVEEANEARAVLLRGAPGIGKSALAESVALLLDEGGRFDVVRATCTELGGLSSALRGAFERLLGVERRSREEAERAARELLRQLEVEDEEELRDLLAFLRPPEAAGDEGAYRERFHFAVAGRLLRRLSRRRAVLLLLDDLDLGGEGAASFLEHLLNDAAASPYPLLAVGCARDGGAAEPLSRALARSRHRGRALFTLPLGPIEEEALARHLERSAGLEEALARQVAARAGGNPLFARLLAEAPEALPAMHNRPTRADSSLPVALHELLEAHLLERLDRAEDRRSALGLLERLAILGDRAPMSLLLSFMDEDPQEVEEELDELIELGLLGAELAGEEEVFFRQALVAEVLLSRLSPRKAARLHRRAAELRMAERAETEPGAIGDHLAHAGQLEEAADWWLKAAERAERLGDPRAALGRRRAALAEMGRGDPRRGELALKIGRELRALGDFEGALAAVEGELRTPDERLLGAELLGEIHHERGDPEAWRALIEEVDRLLLEASPRGRRAGHRARAFYFNMSAGREEALAAALAALEGSPPGEEMQRALRRTAYAYLFLGDVERGTECARALADHTEGRLDLEAEAMRTCSTLLAMDPTRRYRDEAIEQAEAALALFRRIGQINKVVSQLVELAFVLILTGNEERAAREATAAMEAAEKQGLTYELLRSELIWLYALQATDPTQALSARIEALREKNERAGIPIHTGMSALMWPIALCREGEVESSLAHFEEREGFTWVDAENRAYLPLLDRLGEAFAARALEGHPESARLEEAARGLLRRCLASYEAVGPERDAARCRERLAALGDAPTPAEG